MEHHGELHESLTQEKVLAAAEADEHRGFCLACGREQNGIEPDAHNIKCEHCHAHRVYGAEQIIIEGLV